MRDARGYTRYLGGGTNKDTYRENAKIDAGTSLGVGRIVVGTPARYARDSRRRAPASAAIMQPQEDGNVGREPADVIRIV